MEFSFLSRFLTTGQWQIHVKSRGSLELGLSPNIYVMVSFIHWTWTWVIKLFFLSLVCFPCFRHIWYIWRENLYSLSWYHFGGLSSTWNASHTYPLSCSLGLSYMKALPWGLSCCPNECDRSWGPQFLIFFHIAVRTKRLCICVHTHTYNMALSIWH